MWSRTLNRLLSDASVEAVSLATHVWLLFDYAQDL